MGDLALHKISPLCANFDDDMLQTPGIWREVFVLLLLAVGFTQNL